ncbi:hypothetical protein EON65_36930 [archaeon]|nr:MAG: hypothetical protein EON65_36930 [archaeon]
MHYKEYSKQIDADELYMSLYTLPKLQVIDKNMYDCAARLSGQSARSILGRCNCRALCPFRLRDS